MAQTQDEGFHEIQLNGKQLVFLFMAATVVSVVIFLCGVLVGRGVRAERATIAEVAQNTGAEPTPQQPPPTPAAPPAGSDPTVTAPPPPASEDLSYFNRLDKQKQPSEELKPATAKPVEPKPSESAKASEPKAPPAEKPKPQPEPRRAPQEKPAPAATAPAPVAAPPANAAEPSGSGFAVQIAALAERSEADAIAKRLTSKGYAAYVLAPPSGSPSVFRVRVGKFSTRREAESVATRLQKEEQFKPWVTR